MRIQKRRFARMDVCLGMIFVMLFCFMMQTPAQSALDGFDPNANGSIRAVVVQPDGKILIGGDFTTLAPNGSSTVKRRHIARLNPNGTIDAAFDPGAGSYVSAIAVQPDGKILVGGAFYGTGSIGGQTRNFIARLNADGTADSFDPNADEEVDAIAVQADGKILAGGFFTNIGAQNRSYLARLNADGTADSFNPNANDVVLSIAVQTNGKILVGGAFNGTNGIGGQTRDFFARLNADGTADSFNPGANNVIFSIAVEADGKVLAGGAFTNIGGQPRSYIARLAATTGAADSFNPNANDDVRSIAVQADGKILAGGFFTNIGGQSRNFIARLEPASGAADSFDPNASSYVVSIAVQTNGKILVGGDFTALAPNGGAAVTRRRIARLEPDGRLDQTLNANVLGGSVTAIALQADGKILIGGAFTSVLGASRSNIARLNADGTLDAAFNPNADNAVNSIAVQADGKILAGGAFTNIGGQTRSYLARLDQASGAADTFNPNANNEIDSIVLQADGKILVGGAFSGTGSIGGRTRNFIARLNADGTADSFDPNANDAVYTIALQPDGKILTGGKFSNIGSAARNRIARLGADGAADSFDPNANNIVYAIAVQADGKVLAGGAFTNVDGAARNRIARLDQTSGAADSFDPNADDTVCTIAVQADGKILAAGFFTNIGEQGRYHIARLDATSGAADSFNPDADGSAVNAIAVQTDGKILAGGNFGNIGGQPRNLFARLRNDTAALQNLSATQSTVSWTRDGASPLLFRVVFEQSLDGVNYTPLGSGMNNFASIADFDGSEIELAESVKGNNPSAPTAPSAANWTLTGLNLPTGQNIYIRARGFYRSGYQNGSQSITETVRNVYFQTIQTYEADVSPRGDGDGAVDSLDVSIIQAFQLGYGLPYQTGEFQRADCAPFGSRGDGKVDSLDVSQAQAYQLGFNLTAERTLQPASGPSAPTGGASAALDFDAFTEFNKARPNKEIGGAMSRRQVRVLDKSGSGGQSVVIPIEVDAQGDESVYGFTVSYDHTKLTNPVVSIGTAGGVVASNTTATGRIGVSVTFGGGTIQAGDHQRLVEVRFNVADGASPSAASPLALTDSPSFRSVASSANNGAVRALPTIFTDGVFSLAAGKHQRSLQE